MGHIVGLNEIQVSYSPTKEIRSQIRSSTAAYQLLRTLASPDTMELKEEAIVLYLNRSQQVLGWYRLSSGGLTGTVVDIRLLLGIALKAAACGIILCHNHPSGNLAPSETDRILTQKVKDAGKLMDIALMDHLIITPQHYFSFADEGLL